MRWQCLDLAPCEIVINSSNLTEVDSSGIRLTIPSDFSCLVDVVMNVFIDLFNYVYVYLTSNSTIHLIHLVRNYTDCEHTYINAVHTLLDEIQCLSLVLAHFVTSYHVHTLYITLPSTEIE